jgi:hypothetical protein
MKDGCIWIHRSKYRDTSSPLIAEVWSGNGWVELQSEEITEDIKEILDDIEVLSGEVVGHGQAIDALELKIDDLVEITYSDLKALRDAGNLVPGRQYRITDYDCTTVQEDTQSAMKPFDIIVVADSNNTLNENARAIQSARDIDGYFSNSNLAAWQLKYSLDNDTERFAWADVENGKGVIYRMIDEFNNDCPYDFKNIQFQRTLSFDNGYPEIDESGDLRWVWTFTANSRHIDDDVWADIKDGSLESPYGHQSDEDTSTYWDNIIKPYYLLLGSEDDYTKSGKIYLNNIVFLGSYDELNSSEEDESPSYSAYCSYGNTFGLNCRDNTFGINCNNNTFGDNCYNNTFGINCYNNTFGINCNNNTFGLNCRDNTFDNNCISNTFCTRCNYNTFDNNCNNNTFGNRCYSNTFCSRCNNNTFGNDCDINTFGDECSSNTFGNVCSYNTFGNYCSYNTFGQNDNINKVPINYCRYIRFVDNIQYVNIVNSQTASSHQVLKNIEIRDIVGTSDSRVNITADRNLDYTTFVQKNSSGEIKQFCLADLVQ